MGQREHGVEIGGGQQLVRSSFDPTLFFESLAFRAVAIAAGIVTDLDGTALRTAVDVTAQCRGATVLNGAENFVDVQGMVVAVHVFRQVRPQDVGDLELRSRIGTGSTILGGKAEDRMGRTGRE